jgi:polar amino acid transport system substrate-binding protein
VQWADSRDGQRINLHKLLAGRITVLVDSEEAVFHLARRMGIEAYIRLAGRFDPAKRFSAGFSPATGSGPALAQALDLGLAELRRSGRLALLLETYGLRNGELVP